MKITQQMAKKIGEKYYIDFSVIRFREFWLGLNTELEHFDVTKGDLDSTAKITIAHLKEDPKYYYYLDKIEKKRESYWEDKTKPKIFTR